MSIDALDLDAIGRELKDEFTSPAEPCSECGWACELSRFSQTGPGGHWHVPPREDAERLVRLLDRLGFKIVKAS